jgi:hypothetical protein
MRPDAVLTALPDERDAAATGRRRKRGADLPRPEAHARDDRERWRTCEAELYGCKRKVRYKELCGQWYRACGVGLLRIVVVQVSTGALGCRVFFCTDATRTVREVLEGYAGRWANRSLLPQPRAGLRLRPVLGPPAYRCGARRTAGRPHLHPGRRLVHRVRAHAPLAAPPVRPWYRHKQGCSFADVLRTAQRVLTPLDVLDPPRSVANLRRRHRPAASSSKRRRTQVRNCAS